MKYILIALALAGLTACDSQPEGEPVARARIDGKQGPAPQGAPSPTPSVAAQVETACRSIIFEDTPLTHCLAIPARHAISTDLGPDGGAPYRSLSEFAKTREAASVAFAMNAGMFDDEGLPIGYYVEDSERLQELNRADGEGNFHMDPNGVFFGTGENWEIRTTSDFLANITQRPEFGTQSGPMLLIDGALHPEISNDGASRYVRNAVGIDERGRAHFVISNAPLSFGKLARFFRDELNATDALYLDGNVSSLWIPSTGRLDTGAPIGPILLVEKRDPQ